MTIRLTNSEAKSFRRCKRQWMLDYYFGYQRKGVDPYNKPLSIGSRVHDVLAHYYKPGTDWDRADAMAYLEAGIARDLEADVGFKKDIKKEADLCRAMLEGYFDWVEEEGIDMSIEVIAPEAEMEVPLIEGATILSKIDARVRDLESGDVGAFEHKTVQSLTDPMRRLQVDTQLLTEHLVEFLHQRQLGGEGERAEFVLYNMLRKVKRTKTAKPPFWGRESVRHNVDELRNHWRHVARVAFEIQSTRAELDAGASHHDVCYPNPTPDCTWDCAFSDLCLSGLMDDGSDCQAAIDEKYETGDPLERYRSSVGLLPRGAAASEVDSAS